MDLGEHMDVASLVWGREQQVLRAPANEKTDAFATDFVSFDPSGMPLSDQEFYAQMQGLKLLPGRAQLMWGEQGQQDSYCLAFRVPDTLGGITTHLSLWRMIDKNWRKQFHIFVEGEDSLEKIRSLT